MGVLDRLRRSPAAADLPKVAFPPLHEPVTSLNTFAAATRLDAKRSGKHLPAHFRRHAVRRVIIS